jgi:hypothetical protein
VLWHWVDPPPSEQVGTFGAAEALGAATIATATAQAAKSGVLGPSCTR